MEFYCFRKISYKNVFLVFCYIDTAVIRGKADSELAIIAIFIIKIKSAVKVIRTYIQSLIIRKLPCFT